ncbi:unnamed protein product [Microthlaspi erraticum]|uniref:GRF-type domain-containing protein n=1 Tax=Microthlaspi erraticum TaxID=1685480 RepID=A0A6D2I5A9_9BRAS|nr:unnamed protein product [Microthlaspi erraticum]
MSTASTPSNRSSVGRDRRRVVGVPKLCWCGQSIVELISKSTPNPYRRYYQCSLAIQEKLSNDQHTCKWVDEAYLDEIESLCARTLSLQEQFE